MNKPLVSICCQTYNHKDYISQAIESFLMQKTNFTFEILLRDDASTDGTTQICEDYATKYPELINLLAYKENQWQKGVRPFADNVRRARGKYIALCEGDDYWTDPYKLQKQVDFLEANPAYGLVHTDAAIYYETTSEMISSNNQRLKRIPPSGEVFTSLIIENHIQTLTVMVRKELIVSAVNALFLKSVNWKLGDYPLWLEISKKVKIKYLDVVTSVYRSSSDTVSRSKDKVNNYYFYKSVYSVRQYFIDKYIIDQNFIDDFYREYYRYIFRNAIYYNLKEEMNDIEKLKFKKSSMLDHLILFLKDKPNLINSLSMLLKLKIKF